MAEPNFALQKCVYQRLTASAALSTLVDEAGIFDRSGRPEVFPCVIVGEGHAVFSDRYETFHETAFLNVHIWVEEPGLAKAKLIAGFVRNALRDGPWLVEGHICHGVIVEGVQFMRDPSGNYSHGVVTVRAILQEAAA